jgi:hypothetical protein
VWYKFQGDGCVGGCRSAVQPGRGEATWLVGAAEYHAGALRVRLVPDIGVFGAAFRLDGGQVIVRSLGYSPRCGGVTNSYHFTAETTADVDVVKGNGGCAGISAGQLCLSCLSRRYSTVVSCLLPIFNLPYGKLLLAPRSFCRRLCRCRHSRPPGPDAS